MGEVGCEASSGQSANRLVIEHCSPVFRVPPPEGQLDERVMFLGDDMGGAALEVMAVELGGGGLYVIHAMDLREPYRPHYEEAKRWRL